ncbi:MAG TPA: DNA methyltransferase [Labilithrix sp.]|nr:DNA methyltransferase [Labilithrix sp.]
MSKRKSTSKRKGKRSLRERLAAKLKPRLKLRLEQREKLKAQPKPPRVPDYGDHLAAVADVAVDLAAQLVSAGATTETARIAVMRSLWNAMDRSRRGDDSSLIVAGGRPELENVFAPHFRHQQWIAPDDIGFVYERLLSAGTDRKKRGSYYSPLSIVQKVVSDALRPHLPGLMTTDDVLAFQVYDPACGGGAMLLEATRQLAEHLCNLWRNDLWERDRLDDLIAQEPGGLPGHDLLTHRDVALYLVAKCCINGSDIDAAACETTRLALQALCAGWAPLEHEYIWQMDSLIAWPTIVPNAVVMNPPYLGGGKISTVLGTDYLETLQAIYGKGGLADLAVHFLRAAYEYIPLHGTIGVVATNTISQGDTRVFGLHRIIRSGGRIYSAWRDLKWPGDANVIVSIAHVEKHDWNTRPVPDAFIDDSDLFRKLCDAYVAVLKEARDIEAAGGLMPGAHPGGVPLATIHERLQAQFGELSVDDFMLVKQDLVEQGRSASVPTPARFKYAPQQPSLFGAIRPERGAA